MVTQKIGNSKFVYSQKTGLLSYGETALYLSTLGDPVTGVTPVKYVKVLFGQLLSWGQIDGDGMADFWIEQERLPFNEGWRRSSTPINLQSIRSMAQRIVAATANVTQATSNSTNTTGKNMQSASSNTQTTASGTPATTNSTHQNMTITITTTIHKSALMRNFL